MNDTPPGSAADMENKNENEKHSSPATVDVVEITHRRPYKEMRFIGTYLAVGLGALASYGSFVMPATSLALINDDIGAPDSPIVWVALAWTLCLAVGYTLVGRMSDLFGRRWFFTGSALVATVGTVVGATAGGIGQLIGAEVLIGLAAASQLSFNYVVVELVPMKDRFYVVSLIFLMAAPFSAFGPVIARLLIVHTAAGWRWTFYLSIIANGLSTVLFAIFYHPPDFDKLHARRRSRWQEVKDIDVGGIVLFVAGLSLFIMGLSWGGVLYPWGSAHVVATLVVGAVVCVLFVLYECYMPLNRPLIPMHLFRSRDYSVLTIISLVGGMLYYSMNVIYPTMVMTLFTTDVVEVGLLTCAIGGGVAAGQFSSSLWAKPGGMFRWKLLFSVVACTVFTAAMAAAKTQATASALITLAAFFIGALESLVGISIGMVIPDQTEIGTAVGVYGSIRSLGGAVATAIFSAILTNRVADNTAHHVVPALLEAGLPPSSVETLLNALASGSKAAIMHVPGVTKQIVAVAVASTKAAYSNAFTLLFLVSLAFGGLSILAACFSPAIEHLYTDEVMRRLNGGRSEDDI